MNLLVMEQISATAGLKAVNKSVVEACAFKFID